MLMRSAKINYISSCIAGVAFKNLNCSVFNVGKGNKFHHSMSRQNIALLGSLCNLGQPRTGTEVGPGALREIGLAEDLERLGHHVEDYGDVSFKKETQDPVYQGIKNMKSVSEFNFLLYEKMKQVLIKNQICINLGGDHSTSIGSILGHHAAVNKKISVLWVDAHADINTSLTSTSGNMHGMPLSFLIKELSNEQPVLPGWEWVKPVLSARDVVFIGLRDVDCPEREIIKKYKIKAYSMEEIDEKGIATVVKETLEYLPISESSFHLSFDVDALDILEAPSTGTAVPGGMTLREAHIMMEILSRNKLPTVLDVVEVNPLIGNVLDVRKTCLAAKYSILSLFGRYRGGGKY